MFALATAETGATDARQLVASLRSSVPKTASATILALSTVRRAARGSERFTAGDTLQGLIVIDTALRLVLPLCSMLLQDDIQSEHDLHWPTVTLQRIAKRCSLSAVTNVIVPNMMRVAARAAPASMPSAQSRLHPLDCVLKSSSSLPAILQLNASLSVLHATAHRLTLPACE